MARSRGITGAALLIADVEDPTERERERDRDGSRFAVELAIITKLFSICN